MQANRDLKAILGQELDTLKKASLADEAAEKLRELILLEKLPPGCPINERELSELLGISRTPVREAIRQLEATGLVVYSETRRPQVADPPMEQLANWLVIQGSLEALAGELACVHATDRELSKIAQLQEQMVELADAQDRLKLFSIDMRFHSSIVAASHNPELVEVHNVFNAKLWRARFVSSQRHVNKTVQLRKHQEIVDALLARDPRRTARALCEHLGNAEHNIAAALALRGSKVMSAAVSG